MPGKSNRKYRRRGAAVYVATLMIGMVVTGSAVTLLSMSMSNRRLSRNIQFARQAELTASSGLEWALGTYNIASTWRSTHTSGQVIIKDFGPTRSVGVTLTDPDGSFTDDDTDSAKMTVSAEDDGAKYSFSADFDPKPHETLARALYARGTVEFLFGATVSGPIHADLGYIGIIGITANGNGTFSTLDSGVVVGFLPNLTRVPSVEPFPAPDMNHYVSRATTLVDSGGAGGGSLPGGLSPILKGLVPKLLQVDLSGAVMSESVNAAGALNANGIYLINASGKNVNIDTLHLQGTLIIVNTNALNTIQFTGGCRLEPGSKGYPTLLVPGPASGVTFAPTLPLDEATDGVDYNQDGDKSDVIASGLFGITWCGANSMTLGGSGTVYRGSIIANNVSISNSVILDDSPTVATRLVHSFTDNKLHLRAGSVCEAAP